MPWKVLCKRWRNHQVTQSSLCPSHGGPWDGDSFSGEVLVRLQASGHPVPYRGMLTKPLYSSCRLGGCGRWNRILKCWKWLLRKAEACQERQPCPSGSLSEWQNLRREVCSLSEALGLMVPGWLSTRWWWRGRFLALRSLGLIISLLYTGGSNGYTGKQQIWYFYFLSKLKAVLIQKWGKLRVGPHWRLS